MSAISDPATRTELEAAAFRRLVAHLQAHTEVQNIDLMNLAGFCRNCLSNWLEDAAKAQNVVLDRATAREHVYGMPYDDWKAMHQKEASQAQQSAFTARDKHDHR
ncbi:SMc04008-like domain containing protein [Rhabdaerophilaceae bacterium]